MWNRLARRLRLEPEEMRRALELGRVLFALSGSYTLVKTARDAFFLAELPAAMLPWTFLGVGVLTFVVSAVFADFARRRQAWDTLALGALVAAVSLLAFAPLFRTDLPWVPVAFYLWVNIYGLILFSQFWLLANVVSHAREAKRIFGPVGVGGILGGIFGGLAAAPLAPVITLPGLLAIAALLLVAVAVDLRAARRSFPSEVVESPAPELAAPDGAPLHHPYVRWLALAALCSVVVAALVDFQFKVEIQRRFPDEASMATFLGLFYTASNAAALVLQMFGTGALIQGLGAGWSASILPGGLAAGTALILALPGSAAVAATRLWDQILSSSLSRSAGELFYFPLEPVLRRRAKAWIGAGVERLGDAFAGLFIIGVGAAIGGGTRTFAWATAALLAIWGLAWWKVRRGYVTELGRNLRRLNLDARQSRVSLREAKALREMDGLLASPFERVVLSGIDLLEENAPERLASHMEQLLAHDSTRVRARALGLIGRHGIAVPAERVTAQLASDDPELRIAALRARGLLAGSDPIAAIAEFAHAEDPRLRSAAVLAMTEMVAPGSEAQVRAVLEELLDGGSPANRTLVAEALGRRPSPGPLHDLLAPLVRDGHAGVRAAALRAAGGARLRLHVPALIEALSGQGTHGPARDGLVAFGEGVVGTLGDYLSDPGIPIEIRHAIPRILGDVPVQESVNALFRVRDRSDVRLSYRLLKAANRIRTSGALVRFPRALVTADLEIDLREFLFALVHYRACPIGPAGSAERLFCLALNERMEQAVNRAFRRLALLYPPDEIFAAYRGVIAESPRQHGDALEYLEQALALEHRLLLLPMVDDRGDDERLALAAARYAIHFVSYEDSLAAVAQGDDPWLRAIALHLVGAQKASRLLPIVEANLRARDPRVRASAVWARLALGTG